MRESHPRCAVMVMKSSLRCFFRDAQKGCHCLGLLGLCICESSSMRRLVLMHPGSVRVTLGIQESKVLSSYVSVCISSKIL